MAELATIGIILYIILVYALIRAGDDGKDG